MEQCTSTLSIDFSDARTQTMPTTRARVIRPLFLPQGAQIEIEYNPRRPSMGQLSAK